MGGGHGERAPPARVALLRPRFDRLLETCKLHLFWVVLALLRVEPVEPSAFVEHALLRLAAQDVLAEHGLAAIVRSFDEPQAREQLDERRVLLHRRPAGRGAPS